METTTLVSLLRHMRKEGLTFGDCIAVFGADQTDPFVLAARKSHHRDGEIEIDDVTVVSRGGDGSGAYVLAWIWVENAQDETSPDSRGADEVYLLSDQPFTCVDCGARTEQVGPKDAEERWIERCLACGKRHLVEDDNTTFRNFYVCPNCGHEWLDEWSAMCDDDCGSCGTRHISPVRSEEM